ncbi:hypothetical protein AB0H86_34130 [Streptomyces sp. NPDC050997]|uniref:hypothetical protein n=1 Tax=Streptomyces sp. NPDC050997 TaxID=3155519 RepID=UPI00342C9A4A
MSTDQPQIKDPTAEGSGTSPAAPQAPVVVEQPQALLPPPPETQPLTAPNPGPPPPKDRRILRAVLRWTAAVVVLATVGAGTAYGITRMERTDVPGLATESDGRWAYPELTKPPLPSGSPEPFTGTNKAAAHYADLRALLLPSPEGATEDEALRGSDGWLPTEDFLAEYARDERDEYRQELTDNGLRHIAARGWTTDDGTHTRVYLLHFDTAAVVDGLYTSDLTSPSNPGHMLRDTEAIAFDDDFPGSAQVDDVPHSVYVENKPYGAEQVRQAYLSAGDVLGVVIQSRKGAAKAVPFQQTVILQSQLLG